jgi:hypothetical protein
MIELSKYDMEYLVGRNFWTSRQRSSIIPLAISHCHIRRVRLPANPQRPKESV